MTYGLIVSFCISIIPFLYYYVLSFKLLKYFEVIEKSTMMRYATIVTFSMIGLLICMTFGDVLTLSYDKEWLEIKEVIGIIFILLFEVVIIIIAPLMYCNYKKIEEGDNHGSYSLLGVYYGSVIIVNAYNYLFGRYYDKNDGLKNNYGFHNDVPEGLARYAKIDNRLYQIVYFNFGLLMAIGKFIGFTYMPYGMSKWVSQFLFNDYTHALLSNSISNEVPSESLNEIKHITFSTSSDDEEYESLTHNTYSSSIPKTSPKISISAFSFGLFSLCLILLIIYSKLSIIYIKIFYNICGIECGLLAYRYDEIFSLETIVSKAASISTSSFKLDHFIFAYMLLFRMLTLIHSITLKGISFLSITYTNPCQNLCPHHLLHLLSIILFSSFVLIYDFTYLLPDYMRFNGLDQICDYSIIHKSYCGVSFFGLLFIKISMNHHLFMYWDIIASLIFMTNSIIWVYRLIIIPCTKKVFS